VPPGRQRHRRSGIQRGPSGAVLTEVPRRRLVAIIVATTVTGITTNTLITPVIPDIVDAFGASDAAAGYIVAAGSLPGVVVAPMIGFLADRFGRREVLVPCMTLFALAGGAAGLSPTLGVLLALRVLQGVGSAGLINLAIVVIGDHWDDSNRARMIGRNSAILTVCLAVFPFLGGALADLGGWRTPFALYPLGLITAFVIWRGLPRWRGEKVHPRRQLAEVLPVLKEPRFVATAVATVIAFSLIFGALLTILPLYAERQFGLSATGRGILLGLPSVGSTTGALLTGRLTDRFGRRLVLLAAAGLFASALLILGTVPTLVAAGIAVILFGGGEGLMIPSLQDLAITAGTTAQRGTLVATQVGMARLGQTTGPLAIGPFAAATSPATAFLACAALAAVPLMALNARATRAYPADERAHT
jgi:MFS transporter, ACDE family, multidrug resistance protein